MMFPNALDLTCADNHQDRTKRNNLHFNLYLAIFWSTKYDVMDESESRNIISF